MPILTLGQVCSTATALAGGRSDWALSEASLWANIALEQVTMASGTNHKSRESLYQSSTTSGGYRIALPSDFDTPLAVTLYQGSTSTITTSRTTLTVPLIQRDVAWIDAQPDQTLGGVPENFVWFGTWLELFQSPNSAYSLALRYRAKPTELVSSASTAALSSEWNQAWLYKTAELLEASRSNPAGEAVARNRYLSYVNILMTDRAKSQQDRRSMGVRFGGGRLSGTQTARHD